MPRERDVRGQGKGGHRVGDGLGGGPVGPGSYSGRPNGNTTAPGGQTDRSAGGMGSGLLLAGIISLLLGSGKKGSGGNGGNGKKGGGLLKLIIIVVIAIVIISALKSCMTVYEEDYYSSTTPAPVSAANQTQASAVQTNYGAPFGIETINANIQAAVTPETSTNTVAVDTTLSEKARGRYYSADKPDNVNIIIYMIGTDLESQYGMGTNDLKEIVAGTSTIPDNVHFIIYGGGCKSWKNNIFSNSTNYIYELSAGGNFKRIEDCGNETMTDSSTLGNFLRFVRKNYQTDTPNNRNILVLWDHGGGSVTGYGYDERHASAGSMNLSGINKALTAGGIKFDIVGFDACLMATTETAQMLTPWADYFIASEESEPGIGWYYTNWVKKLCNNTSIPTVELAKTIIDDFVDVCAQQCRGQDTTLSVIDLAQFQAVVPKALNNFALNITGLVNEDYRTVATARSSAKEFASSSKIDQVDIISLAKRINTEESDALVDALNSCIRYNRTSSTVANAYGLSIYFPYRGNSVSSYVKQAVSNYSDIGLAESYSTMIKSFASASQSGQHYSNAYGSPFGSLSGYGNYAQPSNSYSSQDIYGLLSTLMSEYSGGYYSNYGYGRTLNLEQVTEYIQENQFDANQLVWTMNDDGLYTIALPKEQWELITEVKQNLFVDDGAGYIDYGMDLTADCFTKSGELVGEYQGYWLSVDGWECAYYIESDVTDQDGNEMVIGSVPCLFNDQRAYLVVQHFNGKGEIVGVKMNYIDEGSDVASKIIPASEFKAEDTIRLIADYYDYDNNYVDNWAISDELLWGEGLEVYDVELQDPASANATYRFVDIYGNTFWTPVMK